MLPTRRDFLAQAGSAALAAATPTTLSASDQDQNAARGRRPNVVLYVADQVRWDFVRAAGLNPDVQTPNLDAVAANGTLFRNAMTNQPLCSPSRACMLTGRYATETGMWKLPPGVSLRHDLPTLATVLRNAGYTANFFGKWHLAPLHDEARDAGYVPSEERGGFVDTFEGANVLATTTGPYSGTIWDTQGKEIHFEDQYRANFITDRVVRFLEQPQSKPFLLFISQQEPHQQNNVGYIAPKGYAERYQNAYVPPDLLHLPGDWQQNLPGYYGDMQRIDELVGVVLKTLERQGMLDNTIFVFTSDHSNHFRTRNREYKRSPHDASIHIPLIMQGPGCNSSTVVDQIVGNIDLTPTLLDLCGVPVPPSMKGRSASKLLSSPEARSHWENEQLIQISGSMVARAIRTPEWTYCVADPNLAGNDAERSSAYVEYQMYNNFGDVAQLTNLAGRAPEQAPAEALRRRLLALIERSGEPLPQIRPAPLYP